MPYLEDGTPVDMVLNPLGVPSRMNVGQILEPIWAGRRGHRQAGGPHARQHPERHGAARGQALERRRAAQGAGRGLRPYRQKDALRTVGDAELLEIASDLRGGVPVATPVFDGAREQDIADLLELAGLSRSGQETLIDGRTGVPFDRPVTVGYLYALKLHHLVDDKIHARAIGPYSLVTQQRWAARRSSAGSGFGEMEVWALQGLRGGLHAPGDAHGQVRRCGRAHPGLRIDRQGDHHFEAGIPESFNVLVKEIQALALNVELEQAG